MGVEDRLLDVAVADVGPADGVDLELEVVRRRRGVAAGHVLDSRVAFEQHEPARFVR